MITQHGRPAVHHLGPHPVPHPTVPTAPSDAQNEALNAVKQLFTSWGLPDTLASWAWGEIVKGRDLQQITDIDLPQTAEFKARFPAIADRRAKGLPPISVRDYLNYEQTAVKLMRQAGLPKGFYDNPQDFHDLISNDVDVTELQQRIDTAKQATYNLAPQDQARLTHEFGLPPGSGGLAAYFLDPDKALPLLQRDFEAARLGGQADRAGYALSDDQARALAQQGVNVDRLSGTEFSTLAKDQQLFGALPGEGTTQIGQDQQLAAMFGGNALAQQAIEQRTQQRKSEFEGDVGFATTSKGAVGLGSAQQT